MAKILLVEDNLDLVAMVQRFLVFEKYVVECVSDGAEALDHLKTFPYDLIILDWELPGMNGVEVCKEFRNRQGNTPILMLTGKDTISNKETGLNSGADDYLTKPFDLRELGARIRAILRRPPAVTAKESVYQAGHLTLDAIKHEVKSMGQPVELGPKEFQLLEFLMRHPNQVFTPEALLNMVWSSQSEATEEALRTAMKRLRKKIDPDNKVVRNVHGVGYVLDNTKSE